MIYNGHMRGGTLVFDGDQKPADGAAVKVLVVESEGVLGTAPTTLTQRLLKWAGTAEGLPTDAAKNIDHYLYGHPKK